MNNTNPVVMLEKLEVCFCMKCQIAFTSLKDLNEHVSSHNNKNAKKTPSFTLNQDMFNAKVILKRIDLYKCRNCTKVYTSVDDYRLHKLVHLQKTLSKLKDEHKTVNNNFVKRFKCEECGLKFVQESTLSAHSVIHAPFAHVCECGIGYYEEKDLIAHRQLAHTGKKTPWKSKISLKKYNAKMESKPKGIINTKLQTVPKLKEELVLRKPEEQADFNIETIEIHRNENNKFDCPMCEKTFTAKANVFIHLRAHKGEKLYVCELCNKRFAQNGSLKNHMKIHTGIKNYLCTYCNKAFYNKYQKLNHERIHTKSKPFKCTYCAKRFSDQSAHKRHIRTHTGEKPYTCKDCPMRFSDVSGLIMHKKTHDENRERNFSCDICHKTFFTKMSVKVHLLVHSGLKRYNCNDCGKTFALKRNLNSHYETVHLKIKKFICDYCCKSFSAKQYLGKHIILFHTNCVYCNICLRYFSSDAELRNHKTECTKLKKNKARSKKHIEIEE